MAEHVENSHAAHSGHEANALDPNELFSHVSDSPEIHVPQVLTADHSGHIEIPQPFGNKFPITKFMVIELAVALILCAFFIGLAKALKGGAIPRGKFRNMLEAMLLYFRDNVARPCIGHHDADKFVPFLWTIFFF